MACKSCGPKPKSHSLAVNLKWREECVSTPGHEKCAECKKVPTRAELLGFPYWRCLTISFGDEPLKQLIICPKCYEDPENRFLVRYKDWSHDPYLKKFYSHPRYQHMYTSEEKPQGV